MTVEHRGKPAIPPRPKAAGHKRAAVIHGIAVRCECGWTSSTWYEKGASGNAHVEWRWHVEKVGETCREKCGEDRSGAP